MWKAEAGVTAKDNANHGPGLAQMPYQQSQDCPGMSGAIDVAGA